MTGFRDHFASAAPAYAAFRPRYPAALFAALAEQAPGRHMAWDCATGSGQAAIGLAEQFEQVEATDASAAQLAAALAHPRVRYRQAPADASGLAPHSVELVTVAQALHWLDRPAFYAEARRVLAPGGVVAVWCYGLVELGAGVDEPIRAFYERTVGPYWPPERALVDSGYRTIDFPFAELALPAITMEAELTLQELGGYLGTWSAVLGGAAARSPPRRVGRRAAAPPGPLAAGAAGRPGHALTLLRDVVCPPHLSDTTSLEPGARAMSKGDDRKLAALAKKNAAKAAKAKPIKRRRYDDTLPPEREEDLELRDFFSEMKKREF